MARNTKQLTYDDSVPFIISHRTISITILAAIIFFVSLVSWWKYVYNSPKKVFIGMLNTSLSTPSVTREITNSSGGQTAHQYIQLSFVNQPLSHSVINVSQTAGKISNFVSTETIGTLTTDYSRYLKITSNEKTTTGKPLNFSSVVGAWGTTGKVPTGQPTSAGYLQQAIIGLVPFANLNPSQRSSVVGKLLADQVYTTDYSKAKSVKIGSHAAWQYEVSFNTAKYLAIFKNLGNDMGLGPLPGIDPATYQKTPPLSIGLTIDKASRELVRLTYQDGQQQEDYTSYGLSTPVSIPAKTIPISALQTRLSSVH